jgi:glycosyltransferase involved in cell wall biosynthesis
MIEQGVLISIIMSVYNSGNYIRTAIESVLTQTHQKLELIIVNDGSTDNSESIINEFKDPRIRYFYQENKGQSSASNFGLSKANGDYIKFFDADDIMNAEHLEAQFKKLNGRTDVLVSCIWGRFYDGNPESANFIPESVWTDMKSLDWVKQALLLKYDMMAVWLWLIPKEVIHRVGGWDERLSLNNDFEFSMRLLTNVLEVQFAIDAKLYYRSAISSLSQAKSPKAYEAALLSTDLGCTYLLKKENTAFTRRLCADRYQEWLFRIYPSDPIIVNRLELKILELGGSNRKMDGGLIHQIFCYVLGWKKTKLLKSYLSGIGYRKLPFN